jgi:hypothetical protein
MRQWSTGVVSVSHRSRCLPRRSLPWHSVALDPLLSVPHPPAGADLAIVHVVHSVHCVEGYPAPPPPSGPANEREPALTLDPNPIMNRAVGDIPAPVYDDPHRQRRLLAAGQGWQRTHAFRLEVIEQMF